MEGRRETMGTSSWNGNGGKQWGQDETDYFTYSWHTSGEGALGCAVWEAERKKRRREGEEGLYGVEGGEEEHHWQRRETNAD